MPSGSPKDCGSVAKPRPCARSYWHGAPIARVRCRTLISKRGEIDAPKSGPASGSSGAAVAFLFVVFWKCRVKESRLNALGWLTVDSRDQHQSPATDQPRRKRSRVSTASSLRERRTCLNNNSIPRQPHPAPSTYRHSKSSTQAAHPRVCQTTHRSPRAPGQMRLLLPLRRRRPRPHPTT